MCLRKKIVSSARSLVDVIDKGRAPRTLEVGYVGHWASADQTVGFLKRDIVPVIQKYGIKVKVDNTACLATDNPYTILNFLNRIPEGQKINFSGNQAISTGMWDPFTPGKNNFWAKIDGAKSKVTFPDCDEFEDRKCYGMFQRNEKGVCLDKSTGEHVVLRCEKPTGAVKTLSSWKRMPVTFTEYRNFYGVTVQPNFTSNFFTFQDEILAADFMEEVKKDARILLKHNARK